MQDASIRVGLLGFGTVGEGVYRMLESNASSIAARTGAEIELTQIGIRNLSKERNAPASLFTDDLESIVTNPNIDVIIEVIGGTQPAGALLEAALKSGKHVVSANKELIAKEGARLLKLAAERKLDLHYEAAVGGGIPLLQPLRHQLAGNDVLKMMGIVNGTTNYILTKMTEDRSSLEDALAEAQAKGYAEADPTADIDGFDAQYKTAILASIAFNREVLPGQVYREGICKVSADDIHYAQVLGYRIKLLGIVEATPGGILARVHPTFLPRRTPLANVNDVYNAVQVQGDFVGDVIFSGRGAGSDPTASAVVGDLIDVCRNIRLGGSANVLLPEGPAASVPISDLVSRYYLRMRVLDEPKVLGAIASALGDFGVGLAAMEMRVLDSANLVGEIVFLTHRCQEAEFVKAISSLETSKFVRSIDTWIRVEE